MDVLTLSRAQFGLHSAFHYIYPPMSIGLGLMLVIFEGIYLKTRKPIHRELTKFWVRVFALIFALGVATGLVQIFGFGTNWARYSRFVGDVFGSALGAEGIFAFFLEAGFLGIVLFGWDRVKPGVHYLATILVCFGAHFSAVWIVIANSWMQTPTGYAIIGEGADAKAVVTDFWAMIFNPSSVDRVTHVIIGSWLAGIFLVLSVSAYYMLKKKHHEFSRLSMKVGLIAGMVAALLQLVSADSTSRGVAKNQPTKLAAMEGVFLTEEATPMTLIGYIDNANQTVRGIQVPGLLSFLVHHNFKDPVTGLDATPREDWPNIQWVFQTYHIMIYMWFAMFFSLLLGCYYFKKGHIENKRWLLWIFVFSVGFPQIANQVGWFTAEMGRQPWIVYNLMRTKDGISTNINAAQVTGSITMFSVIFILLFVLFIYLLNYKIQHGPDDHTKDIEPIYSDHY